MSDQTTSNPTKQPGTNLCPVCGAENCPAGYHDSATNGGSEQEDQK
jgi:hypothetical protein